jgi:hypothetical protein
MLRKGKKTRNAVVHLVDDYKIDVRDNTVVIQGRMGWAKQRQMDSLHMVVLRLIMGTLGRFFPNLIRKGLQALLVTGKKSADILFERRLTWQKDSWHVEDRISSVNWQDVESVCIGCDQTSIYVVMSRTFHPGQLFRVIDLSAKAALLKQGEVLVHKRALG